MSMYELNSMVLASLLLAGLFLAMELGYRLGRRRQAHAPEAVRSHINGIQASLLGILGLLLGFAFSQALQRNDQHSEAVIAEANTISTAWLRCDLLAPPERRALQDLVRRYADLRVQAGGVDLAHQAELDRLTNEARNLQIEIWDTTIRASAGDSGRLAGTLLIPAVNDLFDAFDRRQAELRRHVPEVVRGSSQANWPKDFHSSLTKDCGD